MYLFRLKQIIVSADYSANNEDAGNRIPSIPFLCALRIFVVSVGGLCLRALRPLC